MVVLPALVDAAAREVAELDCFESGRVAVADEAGEATGTREVALPVGAGVIGPQVRELGCQLVNGVCRFVNGRGLLLCVNID